jgi:exodeoxyribonuclease III
MQDEESNARDAWTVTTLNVNGLRSGVRRGFGRWVRRQRPDVLCLQEIRLDPAVPPKGELAPPRTWKGAWNHAQKKGYSGVAVWSRQAPLAFRTGTGLAWSDLEGRVLVAEFDRMRVVSVYIPSGSRTAERQARKDAFLDHFLGFTSELLKDGRPTVMCGDLNIAHTELDIHNPSGNRKNSGFLPHERDWMDRLFAQGWVDVYRKLHPGKKHYSWWSNLGRARELDRGWRLDYQVATPDLADRAVEGKIERLASLSDHAPVTISYRL